MVMVFVGKLITIAQVLLWILSFKSAPMEKVSDLPFPVR